MSSILVIRAGALGDLVFCFQAFDAIRRAHPDAEIALLTRAPFADFARSMPWFDRVIADTHPLWKQPAQWRMQIDAIRALNPTRIYDLQGKTRQSILYALLGGPFGPEWSGAAPLCRFPRPWPPAPDMHFTECLTAQLAAAGVPAAPPAPVDWLDAPVEKFALPEQYAVLIPGCSPGAPYKRWPPEKFAQIAVLLKQRGLACVTVGTKADAEAVAAIKQHAPDIIDLCGRTGLLELAGVLRHAVGVIGNDTGPLHMAAAVGAPTLALFSRRTRASWSKPPGPRVLWRQSDNIADLSIDTVRDAFDLLLQHPESKSR